MRHAGGRGAPIGPGPSGTGAPTWFPTPLTFSTKAWSDGVLCILCCRIKKCVCSQDSFQGTSRTLHTSEDNMAFYNENLTVGQIPALRNSVKRGQMDRQEAFTPSSDRAMPAGNAALEPLAHSRREHRCLFCRGDPCEYFRRS